MILANIGLREINIATDGRDLHHQIEHIARMWGSTCNPVYLTMFDRTEDSCSHIVATIVIGSLNSSESTHDIKEVGSQTLSIQELSQEYFMD